MRNPVLWVVLWIVTLAGAWWIGAGGLASSSGDAGGDGATDVAALRAENQRLRTALANRGPVLQAGEGAARTAAAEEAAEDESPGAPGEAEPKAKGEVAFEIESAKTADEVLQRFFAYVQSMLAKGEEGHLELLETFNDMLFGSEETQQKLKQLFGDDDEAARFIYPMIRFMVQNEAGILGLSETAYKTMATNPAHFEGYNKNTLEVFTEGLAYILPGAVSEARLETFREHARKILDTPKEQQPQAVQQNRNEIQRALRVWAPPLSPQEALAKLDSGAVSPDEAVKLLSKLTPGMIERVDVVRWLGPGISNGDYRAMSAIGRVRLTASQRDQLDQQLIQGAGNRRINEWTVRYYLSVTGRNGWQDARGLIEQGLAQGGRATEVFAGSVSRLPEKPDADWVRWALDSYTVSETLQRRLRSEFKLD